MHRQARPVHTPVAAANNYDVFLSLRGPDTRQSFNNHLRDRLKGCGFHVFKDDHDLLGEQIGQGLSQAIENSKIYIPIFSKNYGESDWCLNELHHIMHCHKKQDREVFPVFYDVDVDDVRNQVGEFGKGFSELAKCHDLETVQRWKKALMSATSLTGWSSREIADDVHLVDMVVEKVSSILRSTPWINQIPMLGKRRREGEYEVFLIPSPATKKSLASHLRDRLVCENFSVFSDDDQYLIGKNFAREVCKAMDRCKIFIPIISNDFASSPDSLNSLVQMVECIGKNSSKILLIFYKVDPSQEVLDHFQEDMLQHNVPQYTCQQWKESLKWVWSVGGLVSAKIGNGDEGKLVMRVIKELRVSLENPNA